ncbi:MAG: DUF5320 domain-containing protein [Bacillota bacterium]
MRRGRDYYGPGFWKGGPGPWGGQGGGLRGNPNPNCRLYPWLPRRWWVGGAAAPMPYPTEPASEKEHLRMMANSLRQQLEATEKRLSEFED